MQVEKLSGNPKPLDILAKINQIIDNMVVSVNGSGTDGNGNINVATIPVGFNYVQYPGESAPADIFGGTWENISSQFAGQFFRAEGGNATEFGQSQDCGAPNITGSISFGVYNDSAGAAPHNPIGAFGIGAAELTWLSQGENQRSAPTYFDFYASRVNRIYQLSEVRPVNSTIRIWTRTA